MCETVEDPDVSVSGGRQSVMLMPAAVVSVSVSRMRILTLQMLIPSLLSRAPPLRRACGRCKARHSSALCGPGNNGPAVWHRSPPAAEPRLQVKSKADNAPTLVTDTDTVTAEQSSVAAVQDDTIHQHCP